MTATLRTLAAEFDTQVPELAALLDLGRDYDESAELDAATEAEIREIVAVNAEATDRA